VKIYFSRFSITRCVIAVNNYWEKPVVSIFKYYITRFRNSDNHNQSTSNVNKSFLTQFPTFLTKNA